MTMIEETLPGCYEIQAAVRLTDAQVNPERTRWMDESHFDVLLAGGRVVTRDATSKPHANIAVRKPDGSMLLVYRTDCLPTRLCKTAYDVFKVTLWDG
jgi:hypothetical protein